MGSSADDWLAHSDEFPQHEVYLDAYWIDQTEVTNAMFAAFLNAKGNQSEGGETWLDADGKDVLIEWRDSEWRPKSGFEDHPVIEVTWYGARAYCQWAGARLPTEAEWEKAARGDDSRWYPWGDVFDCSKGNFDDEKILDGYVVPGGEGCDGFYLTAQVKSFAAGASPYAVYDMAGNVWEWVSDWYASDYYENSPQSNPQGPTSGESRVFRGGSWSYSLFYVRSANRGRFSPDVTSPDNGFRCARSAASP